MYVSDGWLLKYTLTGQQFMLLPNSNNLNDIIRICDILTAFLDSS